MKNILIVGATKGIGLELTKQLSEGSNNLYAVSRNSEFIQVFNKAVNHILLDVVNDGLENLETFLPNEIHGIVYCPGSINLKPFNRFTTNDFIADFNQNVIGAVRIIQHCIPQLKAAKGASVVMFSTVAVKIGMNFHSSVATSKAAVEGLSKSLAAEYAGSNIRFNVVAPSLTNTPLANALINTPEKLEASNKRHPLQRIGTANELASVVSFLLSDSASWITGQVFNVDGGMSSIK